MDFGAEFLALLKNMESNLIPNLSLVDVPHLRRLESSVLPVSQPSHGLG
jgi:hypothetical protein